MQNKTGGIAVGINYHLALWDQMKTGADYFNELFRVSKNQIIFGANFFVEHLKSSQGWIVWDKQRPDGVSFSDCELAYTSFDCKLRIFRYLWHGMLQNDMQNKESRIHPTQKPIALYRWLLSNYANPGDKILDTHVGSASSLIACKEMGFDFIGFELDETYFNGAIERMQNHAYPMSLF